MAAAPILYSFIDPEGAKTIMMQHPTYASGVAGVYASSIASATQDLHKRYKQTLEDSL